MLAVTDEAERLAPLLLKAAAMASNAATDALHVAVATVHGMDYLLSWNCTHIANVFHRRRLEAACRSLGWVCPEICTPEQLMPSNQEENL